MLLIEASDMLRADPFSAAARKKLIEGSRGIASITDFILWIYGEALRFLKLESSRQPSVKIW